MEQQLNIEFLLILASGSGALLAFLAYFNWRSAVKAQIRINQLEIEIASQGHFAEEVDELKDELAAEQDARIEAEKQVSLMKQRVEDMDQRAKDVEEFKKAAQASVLEAGQKLSSKLLEDHKREARQAKEESEKLAQKTTRELMNNFGELAKLVAALQSRSSENTRQVETVMRALTHPAGAGYMAEVGLENSLKQLGLESERDFIMQHHITTDEGPNLRPDAVVFLPQDMVMVIDSKASKFIIELAEAEGTDDEATVLKSLVMSMHQHIDALARKQYADAVARILKSKGHRFGRMLNIMYLPSDAAIEKLRKADKAIADKCEKADIVLAGPSSLAGLFSLARQQISAARQDENQQKIIAAVRELMDYMVIALNHAAKTGAGIKSAADHYEKFAKSLNSRLLPKLRNLQNLGVEPSKNKSLPTAIASYEVRRSDEVVTLEAETDDTQAITFEQKQSA